MYKNAIIMKIVVLSSLIAFAPAEDFEFEVLRGLEVDRGCSCPNVAYEFTIDSTQRVDEDTNENIDCESFADDIPRIEDGFVSCNVETLFPDNVNNPIPDTDGYFVNGQEMINAGCDLLAPDVQYPLNPENTITYNYTSGSGEIVGTVNLCNENLYNIRFLAWETKNGVTRQNTVTMFYGGCTFYPELIGKRVGWFTFTDVYPVDQTCPYRTPTPTIPPSGSPSMSNAPTQPTPEPTPDPTPDPTPEPTPEPTESRSASKSSKDSKKKGKGKKSEKSKSKKSDRSKGKGKGKGD